MSTHPELIQKTVTCRRLHIPVHVYNEGLKGPIEVREDTFYSLGVLNENHFHHRASDQTEAYHLFEKKDWLRNGARNPRTLNLGFGEIVHCATAYRGEGGSAYLNPDRCVLIVPDQKMTASDTPIAE